jgi:hypothetical protein
MDLGVKARGFGDTTLNAVGVAFANTCLGLVFLVMAILNKNLLRKALYLLVAFAAVFVVFSSASRGAIIWGSLAMVFFCVLNRHRLNILIFLNLEMLKIYLML